MALNRDDLTIDKGNIGYGTMASLPEPGSAGDLAAEAASAGIVNTDASAELAAQIPNIVVPLNPEVRGDDQFITNEGSDSNRNIDTNINTGIKTLNTGNIITTSREFCKRRIGKTYTETEIRKIWAASSWSGKSSGDPFIVRGGYNCQHHWQPMAESFFDNKGELII